MYKIISTKTFFKVMFKTFEKIEFLKFNKFKEKLKLNPYLGDMVRVYYVREFRLLKGKRVFFIIYNDINLILFVAISNKKNQKIIIENIFKNLNFFKLYAYKFKN